MYKYWPGFVCDTEMKIFWAYDNHETTYKKPKYFLISTLHVSDECLRYWWYIITLSVIGNVYNIAIAYDKENMDL